MIPLAKLSKELRDKFSDEELRDQLDALEFTIRACTRNKFHIRGKDFEGTSTGGKSLLTSSARVKVGDRVELVDEFNQPVLAFVEAISPLAVVFDKTLPEGKLKCYPVAYPPDVVTGVAKMVAYQALRDAKLGIKSETVGRHSVSFGVDSSIEGLAGYPAELTGFLAHYRRART